MLGEKLLLFLGRTTAQHNQMAVQNGQIKQKQRKALCSKQFELMEFMQTNDGSGIEGENGPSPDAGHEHESAISRAEIGVSAILGLLPPLEDQRCQRIEKKMDLF